MPNRGALNGAATRVAVSVISAGRPAAVARMTEMAEGMPLRWYVPGHEVGEYRLAGAEAVVATSGLCQARNAALDDARPAWCVQLSDDLRRLNVVTPLGQRPIRLVQAISALVSLARRHDARLAGAAPTDNPYFTHRRVSLDKFIVGDLMAVAGDAEPRFDTALLLKEDYDFTLQHLARYGTVLRWEHLLASFDHKTNRGGAVAYRTHSLEQTAIGRLKAKWPGCIMDNPRRPDEVLLRWPAP